MSLGSTMLGQMRRNGLLVGGWALATLLALVLGLQGIRSVSNSVTDHRPPPLSPSSVRAALQRTSTSTSTTTVVSASSASSVSSVSSATGGGPEGSSLSPDVVVPHVNGDVGTTASDAPSVASDNNAGSGAANDPETSSSDGGPGSGSSASSSSESSAPFEDRIYELEGGTVAVRFQNGEAHLLWATPNGDEGYRTDQAQENGGTVDVRFRNDQHESRLRAYWDNGPHGDIEENDEG